MISFNSCTKDTELKILRKKWKIIHTVPFSEGSYWMTGLDIIDLSNLEKFSSKTSKMYLEKKDGKILIKYPNNDTYLEIVTLTEKQLSIILHGVNQDTKEKEKVLMMECIAIEF